MKLPLFSGRILSNQSAYFGSRPERQQPNRREPFPGSDWKRPGTPDPSRGRITDALGNPRRDSVEFQQRQAATRPRNAGFEETKESAQ
jgi:hypothetical protein